MAPVAKTAAVELVAAVARDHVDLHAADRRLRRQRAGLIADLVHQPVVEVEAGLVAAEADVLDLHVVDHEHVVVVRRAVHLQRRLLHDLRAADVGRAGRDAGNQLTDGEQITAGPASLLFEYDDSTHLVTVSPTDLDATVTAADRSLAGDSLRNRLTREQFYFVMTDRFANGDTGNDLGGLDRRPVDHRLRPDRQGLLPRR